MNKVISKIRKELSYQTGRYVLPPEFLSLVITGRCNFRCRSCSVWQNKVGEEMSEAEWAPVIAQLCKELKPETFVEINGGEPLLRADLVFFLIKELKKHFAKVALNSNGSLLDEAMIKRLKQAQLDTLKISFYSLTKETHDSLRGQSGAFDLAQRAIVLANQYQLGLEVGVLVTSRNIDELPGLIQYLQTLPRTAIILQPLDEKVESAESKNLSANSLPVDLWPAAEQVKNFFSWLAAHGDKVKNPPANLEAIGNYYLDPASTLAFRCFAGQRNLVVYPDGSVTFCFKGGVIGKLPGQNLQELLRSSGKERKRIAACRKYCRIVGCNFSRGLKEFFSINAK